MSTEPVAGDARSRTATVDFGMPVSRNERRAARSGNRASRQSTRTQSPLRLPSAGDGANHVESIDPLRSTIMRGRWRARAAIVAAACTLGSAGSVAHAQDIEPRAYSNAPVSVNFLIAGYAYTRGGLAFDSSVPITNPQLDTNSGVLGYARVLDLWGLSAKFDAVAPYTWLTGTANFAGQPVERDVQGFGDPKFRLSVNFYGAPALALKDFAAYRQDLIVGASLQVSVPWGQYDNTKVVNIGTNRGYLKPEVGISKALGQWTLEAAAAVTVFADNKDFFGGVTRSQDPLYSLQGHLIYSFPRGIWGSLDGTYFSGGRTTLDGTRNTDLQQNWRVGGTLALPVDASNSVKAYASKGVSARTGNNYDLLGIAWQYRWGGGL
ncbi:MAG: transporter [Burkholderiaceae bacterium]|nr:transporter [Burkholderiaceae bacterium]